MKQDQTVCCLQETYLTFKNAPTLKAKRWKMIFHASRNQKKVRVAILLPHKIDIKPKAVTREIKVIML